MKPTNKVFIATSLDGYIADKEGGIAWLDTIPEINNIDTGYKKFISTKDALVMGRTTFETVCSFDIPWPYSKPVFVVSKTLTSIPSSLEGKVHLVNGTVPEILEQIHGMGYYHLYIDGGRLIQSFLREDLIDEMVITVIPILLGGGVSLFGDLLEPIRFECVSSTIFLDQIVQNHFKRKRG